MSNHDVSVPEFVREVLKASSDTLGSLKAVVYSDLGTSGDFLRTWVCMDDVWLYVISQTGFDEKDPATLARFAKEQKEREKKSLLIETIKDIDLRNSPPKAELLTKYPVASIDSLKVEMHVGTIVLIAKIDDKDVIITRALPSQFKDFNNFARLVNALLKNKETKEIENQEYDRTHCPKCGRLYPDRNRPICPKCFDSKSLFKRVVGLTPRYKGLIIMQLGLMALSTIIGLFPSYLSGRVFFDEVLAEGGRYYGQIGFIVFLLFFTSLLSRLVGILHSRINPVITARIVYDLQTMVFSAMQRLSLSFYNNQQTGALMNRVTADARTLQNFFHDIIPFYFTNMLTLIGISVMLFYLDWKLTLLVLIPIPIILFIVLKLQPILWKMFSKRWRANASLNSVVNDSLSGVRVVKAFGKEDQEIRRFEAKSTDVYGISVKAGNYSNTVFPIMYYFMSVGSIIVWGVGGWNVIQGNVTLGTIVSFTGYLGMFYGPIRWLTYMVEEWTNCMNAAQRMFEIIDSQDYLPEPENPVRIKRIEGLIEARNVEFSYQDGKPVLTDVNFTVQPGEMIGLVGHSGAGKSTLINLISRMYDVDSGAIFIDGVDIRDIHKDDLHGQIGMVLQDTFLFNGTVMENIAYAKPDATPEEIIMACKIANAHDFITKLPDGYETVIGRKGQDLSGGERQRLSIARAILHDPRILILDEATASIDTHTEYLIQEAIEKLVKGRTTFAIAHRLSTLRRADRLFVFERGKIVEVGTHAELLKQKGVYYKLFTTQREAMKLSAVGG
ncbi:MAG: ATP-binding cassette domain-containing protein [Firmicutes bacterium]|nr:ATP-binding cassette domain-containing protein [Bacillota bacterium]